MACTAKIDFCPEAQASDGEACNDCEYNDNEQLAPCGRELEYCKGGCTRYCQYEE